MIVIQIFIACSLLHCLIQFVTWIGLIAAFKPDGKLQEQPEVSILLAARNEEKNILHCLQSIACLNYPKEKIQVLIGDDKSEDNTAALVSAYIQDKSYMHLISIQQETGKLKGKANVLAQLAHQATGAYFFITDADITVNPKWIESLLAGFDDKTGIVSGATFAKGDTWLQRMQAIDWTYFGGMLTGITRAGLPCTAVGNNMAVKREAYWSTGGYEKIDFSVTEDYKLYAAVRKKGWHTKNIFTPGSFHFTSTLSSFKNILHQRKRWLSGGMELPVYWKLILAIYGLFSPLFLISLFIEPETALLLITMKLFFEFLITNTILVFTRQVPLFGSFFLHQVYTIILNISLSLFYYIPLPFKWKNRSYSK